MLSYGPSPGSSRTARERVRDEPAQISVSRRSSSTLIAREMQALGAAR